MQAGLVDPGLSGSLLAALWFFHRYHLLVDAGEVSLHGVTNNVAARWLRAARLLAAIAIPLGCVLFFAVLATLTAGAAIAEARWPWLYGTAIIGLLALLIVVEATVFAYYRRVMTARDRGEVSVGRLEEAPPR